ncbi:sigma-70 family RNA polymerase sigma factor [Flexivirga alba]|uniref:Sigma-70 family RNA polymerase sigma factor n=1 Tax=Flexivirga alba TaxID=702742 RepID=A0ABW2ADB2_9MICO
MAPRVHGLVLRVLRDEHRAEEVTQEVFLQIWQNADRFDPQRSSALSWVLMLAHRRAVDHVRCSAASRRRDQSDFERSTQTPRDVTVESVETAHDAHLVRAGLATLSPAQRQALELAYFGGHTHSEVSRLMRTPSAPPRRGFGKASSSSAR